MHEKAFKNIWDSKFSRLLFPNTEFLQLTGNHNSFLADGLREPRDSEKLNAEILITNAPSYST
jgi:hypothetical protein